MFPDDCKLWKHKAEAAKTWPTFKAYFSIAHQDLRNVQSTVNGSPFGLANSAINSHDTVEAIANLVTATAHDRNAVSILTTTNSALMDDLFRVNTELLTTLSRITSLVNKISTLEKNKTSLSLRQITTYTHYCWTCGFNSPYSSTKYTTPGARHKTTAAKHNTMEGSTKNKLK